MSEHHQFTAPTLTADQLLKLEELKLQQEQAKQQQEQAKLQQEQAKLQQEQARTQQKQEDRLAEEAKVKQKEFDLKIRELEAQTAIKETVEAKEERVASRKFQHEDSSADDEVGKRLKTNDEGKEGSTTSSRTDTTGTFEVTYLNRYLRPRLQDVAIPSELEDCNDISDAMVEVFEDCFKPCLSLEKILECNVEAAMDKFSATFFHEYIDATSLKYLNTSAYAYLNAGDAKHRNAIDYTYVPSGSKPDCTFIFKNVKFNIEPDNEFQALQDFVICLGELKAFNVGIDGSKCIVQICRYLDAVLDIQNRQKVYGFITNLRHIRFYWVERKNKESYYYQSPILELIAKQSLQKSSKATAAAAVNEQALNEEKQERRFNKDTIKIFIKFLSMNPTFYGYKMLTINPDENLFPDQYFIKTRSGYGLTSIVYKLIDEKNRNNSRILKICRDESFCHVFLNEFSMLKRLKELNDPDNYNLFFSNIEQASLEGNFLLFEDDFTPIKSMESAQAQQLISIIEYLYQCRIIHRDIRPGNIMIDREGKHIKLIDFGYAVAFKGDEDTKELDIEGVLSCGGIKFLGFYSEQLANMEECITYEYERTFDLECSLNVIMCMTEKTISYQVNRLKALQLKERIDALYELWLSVKKKNKNYNELLNLIDNVSNVSDFQLIKDRIKLLF